jgi:glutathione synthase/RimK-type ligase-like ATP-grasp enzyme
MTDIILLTETRFTAAAAAADDWYLRQILTEDQLLSDALRDYGLRVERRNWADPELDWSQTRMAVFRTTWDYFHRFREFSSWLDDVATKTRLINPPALIRWNMDKHYLQDLLDAGVNIPPTRFIRRGESLSLADLHTSMHWQDEETVLKPTVSGGARHTYRLNRTTVEKHEAVFQELIAQEDMMLQPLQHHVLSEGEISVMIMGGRFTHAVRKVAVPGDFRVQDDFGGKVYAYTPNAEEIALAERAVSVCSPMPLYGRVDMVRDNSGQLAIMEMELIEPELWFRFHPPAAKALAESLYRTLA